MTVKKTGLGKGLDALFGGAIAEEERQKENQELVQKIKLIDIEPNEKQARKIFNDESIEELLVNTGGGLLKKLDLLKFQQLLELIMKERTKKFH